MRVAIIGGSGMMGRWFANFLLKDGKEVVITGRNERKLSEARQQLGVEVATGLSSNLLYQENLGEPPKYLKVNKRVSKRGLSPSFQFPPPSPEGEGGHRSKTLRGDGVHW